VINRNNISLTLTLFIFSLCTNIVTAQKNELNVFAWDGQALQINKQKLTQKDGAALTPAYQALLKKANKVMKDTIYTVMEKKQLPPSGDIHDYMSIAIYYWPDPQKKDGLPYIRKDGQINPEVKDYKDKENIVKMCDNVEILSLAYYFSDDQQYAQKAIAQLRAWFLDKDTKMNPNFNFAQAIKGKNDGRGAGIIESRNFISVVDAVGLLSQSKYWTKADQQGMQQWFESFLQWLTTSKNGIDEMNTKNNHGIWYDAQKLSFALFANKTEIAQSTVKSLKQRLEVQMDTTGFFPAEMERTISLHYSAFVIDPLMMAANMSTHTGDDLWNYQSVSGKSLRKGFDVLAPYLCKEKEWAGQQIKHFDFDMYAPSILSKGYYKYGCAACKEAMAVVCDKKPEEHIVHLITLLD